MIAVTKRQSFSISALYSRPAQCGGTPRPYIANYPRLCPIAFLVLEPVTDVLLFETEGVSSRSRDGNGRGCKDLQGAARSPVAGPCSG